MNYTRFIFFVYGFAFVTNGFLLCVDAVMYWNGSDVSIYMTLLHLAVFLFGLAGVVYLKGEGNAE